MIDLVMNFTSHYDDKFRFNYDDKRRHEILGISYNPSNIYDIKCFEDVTLKQLNLLLEEHFIEHDENQNGSPNTMVYKTFMEKYPNATVHGYIVTPRRGDYRVTIEGLSYNGEVSTQMLRDFIDTFGRADNFITESNNLYCWYD